MKVKLKDIKLNPFRVSLEGGYNPKQIRRLIESFKMSDFGINRRFEVRLKDGVYELVFGHHTRQALLQHYGEDIEVEIIIRNYTDDQMLVEMLRENMTRENEWFSRMQAFQATKKYLERNRVESLDSVKKHGHFQGVGARQIAKFLSTDEETVTKDEVNGLLKIGENLAPEILKEVKKTHDVTKGERDESINFTQAHLLADFKDHEEQKDLAKAMKSSSEQRVRRQSQLVTKYKSAKEETKKAIREGKVDLADVGIADFGYRNKAVKTKLDEDLGKMIEGMDIQQIYYNFKGALRDMKKYPLKDMSEKNKNIMSQIYSRMIKILNSELQSKGWEE